MIGAGHYFSPGHREASGEVVGSRGCGKVEALACLLAAAVHDYEHHGRTNAFLAKTCDQRALK